jgi:hypothetical protein
VNCVACDGADEVAIVVTVGVVTGAGVNNTSSSEADEGAILVVGVKVVGAVIAVLVPVLGGDVSTTAMSTTDGGNDTAMTGGVDNVFSSNGDVDGEADDGAAVTVAAAGSTVGGD